MQNENDKAALSEKFWEEKTLAQMSPEEWEALCDGCGNCCRIKLEDEDSGAVAITPVVCNLLDLEKSSCSDYCNRHKSVPDCIQLTLENIPTLFWLPNSCAYRRLYEGQPLPSWHYLISGDKSLVHKLGHSVLRDAISEDQVSEEDLPDYIEEIIECSNL